MRLVYPVLSGLLVLTTSAAHAQLGVQAGVTFAGQANKPLNHLSGGSSMKSATKAGYQLGLSYRLPLGQRWALVPALLFSWERQQVQVVGGGPSDSFQADYQLASSYLNLPVLLRRQLGRVYLEAGPQGSWLIGGRGEGTRTYSGYGAAQVTYNPVVDQAATDSYSRLDAGLCLGLGLRIVQGLGINVRAYQGLVGCNHYDSSSPTYLPKGSEQAYRQTLQVGLTYDLTPR